MRSVAFALLLVACGGGGGAELDAGDPDSADGPLQMGRVDVTVYTTDRTGAPEPDAVVVFYDPAGAIVSHATTNTVGQAFGILPDGGSVTVLREYVDPGSAFERLHMQLTQRGVKPGDNLVVDIHRDEQRTGAMDSMVVSYTPFGTDDTAIVKPCSPGVRAVQSSQVFFYEDCTTPTFDLMLLSQGQNRQFIWMPDVPYAGGATVEVPDAWQPMGTLTTSFENLPPGDTLVGVFVSTLVGPLEVEMNRGQFFVNPGASTVSHPWPTGAGRGAVVFATLNPPQSLEQHLFYAPGSPSNIAIDFDALPLPRPGHPNQTATAMSWTETGAPSGDLRIARWDGEHTTADAHHRFFRIELSDPTVAVTTSTLLPLPDELADRDPLQVPTANLLLKGASVQYLDYDNFDHETARLSGQRLLDFNRGFLDGAQHVHWVASP